MNRASSLIAPDASFSTPKSKRVANKVGEIDKTKFDMSKITPIRIGSKALALAADYKKPKEAELKLKRFLAYPPKLDVIAPKQEGRSNALLQQSSLSGNVYDY